MVSLRSTGRPRAFLRPGIVSVTTVSAAFRFEGCLHCVPLRDATRTHARDEPILEGRRKTGIPRDEFISETRRYLIDAIDRWILGNDPFTARLNPDIGGYNDYDQLMRLDEWLAHMTPDEEDAA